MISKLTLALRSRSGRIVLALILLMFASVSFFMSAAFAHPHAEAVAHQERICNLYEVFENVLVNQYDEQLIDARKAEHGGRYEIWKSAERGPWTVIEVMPNGVDACVLGSGATDPHTPDELFQQNTEPSLDGPSGMGVLDHLRPDRQAYEKSS